MNIRQLCHLLLHRELGPGSQDKSPTVGSVPHDRNWSSASFPVIVDHRACHSKTVQAFDKMIPKVAGMLHESSCIHNVFRLSSSIHICSLMGGGGCCVWCVYAVWGVCGGVCVVVCVSVCVCVWWRWWLCCVVLCCVVLCVLRVCVVCVACVLRVCCVCCVLCVLCVLCACVRACVRACVVRGLFVEMLFLFGLGVWVVGSVLDLLWLDCDCDCVCDRDQGRGCGTLAVTRAVRDRCRARTGVRVRENTCVRVSVFSKRTPKAMRISLQHPSSTPLCWWQAAHHNIVVLWSCGHRLCLCPCIFVYVISSVCMVSASWFVSQTKITAATAGVNLEAHHQFESETTHRSWQDQLLRSSSKVARKALFVKYCCFLGPSDSKRRVLCILVQSAHASKFSNCRRCVGGEFPHRATEPRVAAAQGKPGKGTDDSKLKPVRCFIVWPKRSVLMRVWSMFVQVADIISFAHIRGFPCLATGTIGANRCSVWSQSSRMPLVDAARHFFPVCATRRV